MLSGIFFMDLHEYTDAETFRGYMRMLYTVVYAVIYAVYCIRLDTYIMYINTYIQTETCLRERERVLCISVSRDKIEVIIIIKVLSLTSILMYYSYYVITSFFYLQMQNKNKTFTRTLNFLCVGV